MVRVNSLARKYYISVYGDNQLNCFWKCIRFFTTVIILLSLNLILLTLTIQSFDENIKYLSIKLFWDIMFFLDLPLIIIFSVLIMLPGFMQKKNTGSWKFNNRKKFWTTYLIGDIYKQRKLLDELETLWPKITNPPVLLSPGSYSINTILVYFLFALLSPIAGLILPLIISGDGLKKVFFVILLVISLSLSASIFFTILGYTFRWGRGRIKSIYFPTLVLYQDLLEKF